MCMRVTHVNAYCIRCKLTLQKCIEIVKRDVVSNTQVKKMNQTLKTKDAHELQSRQMMRPEKNSRAKNSKQTDRKYPDWKHDNGWKPASDKLCINSVEENIAGVEPIVLLGAVFEDHVATGTIKYFCTPV